MKRKEECTTSEEQKRTSQALEEEVDLISIQMKSSICSLDKPQIRCLGEDLEDKVSNLVLGVQVSRLNKHEWGVVIEIEIEWMKFLSQQIFLISLIKWTPNNFNEDQDDDKAEISIENNEKNKRKLTKSKNEKEENSKFEKWEKMNLS